MVVLNGKLFIQYENGNSAIKEYHDIGDGQKLYIDGSFRPEWHAKCVAFVAESGIEGINKGDKVLVDYRVMFRYKLVGVPRECSSYFSFKHIPSSFHWISQA